MTKQGRAERRAERAEAKAAGKERRVGTTSWTGGSRLAAGTATVLLWGCLAAGPAAVALWLLQPNEPPVVDAAEPPAYAAAARAGDVAADVVTRWVSVSRDTAAQFRDSFGLELVSAPGEPSAVREVRVGSQEPGDQDVWSVQVSAQVCDAGCGEPGARWERRQYLVAVRVSGDGAQVQVLTLPTPVADVRAGEGLSLAYPHQVSPGSALGEAVVSFVGAQAAGEGDLARLIAPGAEIDPVDPAPYVGVEVRSISSDRVMDEADGAVVDGAVVSVHAEVLLVRLDGEKTPSTYSLDLTARAGRWEVSDLRDRPLTTRPAA